jgi:hypothetical protein
LHDVVAPVLTRTVIFYVFLELLSWLFGMLFPNLLPK